MSDKCPNCGSESRDFRGITGMLGAICSDEWHDKATILDDKDKRIAELEEALKEISIHCYDADAQYIAINTLKAEGGGDGAK